MDKLGIPYLATSSRCGQEQKANAYWPLPVFAAQVKRLETLWSDSRLAPASAKLTGPARISETLPANRNPTNSRKSPFVLLPGDVVALAEVSENDTVGDGEFAGDVPLAGAVSAIAREAKVSGGIAGPGGGLGRWPCRGKFAEGSSRS